MQRRHVEEEGALLAPMVSVRSLKVIDEHFLSLLDRLRNCESALATWARNGITLGSLAMLLFVNSLDVKQRCFALITMWLAAVSVVTELADAARDCALNLASSHPSGDNALLRLHLHKG